MGGLKGKVKRRIEDYLEGRAMRTLIREVRSNWKKVTSAMPQGLVLTLIMFIIYMNDMPQGVTVT